MRYVASYLLAALGGNASPSAKDIKKILDSVGIEADDDRLNKVISELNGKNLEDVIAQEKLRVAFRRSTCSALTFPDFRRDWQAGQCSCWWGGRCLCRPRICRSGCWRCPRCS
ncbi:60S acidic ribosomal protein P2 isoform X2 [Lutra lutra]|uniref:60S acidic ribosomal protein P2 isoform X2 n=1 Tax=Lutra lutra TaxID=9657 RepID=UPI001FD45E4D|nr:60S acidic ribosomal protein P2 isoform X2 [Lutra lutra]